MSHRLTFYDEDAPLGADTKALIERAFALVLESEGIDRPCSADVTTADDETIRALNREHRNIDNATDVLSFPLWDGDAFDLDHDTGHALLGDIVLSLETARRQAAEYGHSERREIVYLCVHSMLHLLGHDHEDDAQRAAMRAREEAVMRALDLPRE